MKKKKRLECVSKLLITRRIGESRIPKVARPKIKNNKNQFPVSQTT